MRVGTVSEISLKTDRAGEVIFSFNLIFKMLEESIPSLSTLTTSDLNLNQLPISLPSGLDLQLNFIHHSPSINTTTITHHHHSPSLYPPPSPISLVSSPLNSLHQSIHQHSHPSSTEPSTYPQLGYFSSFTHSVDPILPISLSNRINHSNLTSFSSSNLI